MNKLLLGIVLLTIWLPSFAKEIDITKSKGIDQGVITSLSPEPEYWNTDQNVLLKAVFDVELDETSVQKNNVKLKHITQTKESMIDGEVAYNAAENAVTFTPEKLLEEGFYEVEFKSLKATKANKDQQIKEVKYLFYVPEVINGYKLPPEPDETLNNSTLLGIDVNENGVRDDVERWVIHRYKDAHPIMTPLKLQAARAYQKVIVDPSNAKETYHIMHEQMNCADAFTTLSANYFGRKPLVLIESEDSIKEAREMTYIQYNTAQRARAYGLYNQTLSGMVFRGEWESDSWIEDCDFDTTKFIEMSEKL